MPVNVPKSWRKSIAINVLFLLSMQYCFSFGVPGKNIPADGMDNFSSFSFQDQIVRGVVIDDNGDPVNGATVVLSDGRSVVTNEKGEFNFSFNGTVTLKITSVGFKEKSIVVNNPNAPIRVNLSFDNQELEQVTVTALGLSKKTRAVGYAIAEVNGSAVQQAKESNFVNALQGKLAGVQINTNSGSMGGSSKVIIRGNKSITGDNNALFVVDGVVMGNENAMPSYNQQIGGGGFDYGSPIQDINPDDIDQISVLKGASATALYGSRGANGVVLITTKKGSRKSKLGISFNSSYQMDKISYLPKFQNRYGGGGAAPANPAFEASGFDTLWQSTNPSLFKNAPTYTDPIKGGYDLYPQFGVDESWGPELLGQVIRPYYSFDEDKGNPFFGVTTTWSPQPNNVRDFYETGHTYINSISVGAGDEKGAFRVSYSNFSQNFVLPNSNLNRNNLGFDGNRSFGSKLTMVVNANYSTNYSKGRSGTGFSGYNPTQLLTLYAQRQLEMDKLAMYTYPDGTEASWNRTSPSNPKPLFATTPYWHQYMDYPDDNRNRLFGQMGFDYKPWDWANLSARVYMDQYDTRIQERVAKSYSPGSYRRVDYNHQELNYQLIGNVQRDLSNAFSLNVSAGGNIMTLRNESMDYSYSGLITPLLYTLTNNIGRLNVVEGIYQKRINSLFGNVTFGYDNKIFLDLTGRNDWSSTLPKGNNSYFYPGASLSMVFSDWLSDLSWLNMGKLRLSYARIGNDTDPYRTSITYNPAVLFGSSYYILRNPALGNVGLQPEISNEGEIGIDLRFLNNRLGIDLSYYNRTTDGLIIPLTVTATSGYESYFANVGKSRNSGIELQFTAVPIQLQHFNWSIGLNYSANRSKLLKLEIPNNPDIKQYIVGTERRRRLVSTAAVVGEPLFVLLGTDYTYKNGEKVMTDAGLYVSSPGGQVIGNTEPNFIGGITNMFTFKDFSLSALIDFQQGGKFFSYTNMYGMYSGTIEETVKDNVRKTGVDVEGVLEDGTPKSVHVSAPFHFKNNYGIRISAANLYDASYVYLREVRLGYKLPGKISQAIRAQGITLTLYGRNLWLMQSNAPNVDPSNIINSTSNIIGLEGGALPPIRSFGVNLGVNF